MKSIIYGDLGKSQNVLMSGFFLEIFLETFSPSMRRCLKLSIPVKTTK
jgi:hypothetical protein